MASLVPILVRTFGRTGSTLLMQILGTGDNVCFERTYPFENRYLTYTYNMARMVRMPANTGDSWNNDVLFRCEHPSIASLPYERNESIDKDALSRHLFGAIWREFSHSMRLQRGLAENSTAFYAEKVPHQTAAYANELLEARNIFLLRDPRDEMVSIKNFNRKRGFHSFGWQDKDTDLSFATRLCRNRRDFMQSMIESDTDERRIYLRYEDLILDGKREVARLSNWLGTPLNLKHAMKDKAIKAKHMTSKDPASSVERWRKELSHEVQTVFSTELGEELNELGYAV